MLDTNRTFLGMQPIANVLNPLGMPIPKGRYSLFLKGNTVGTSNFMFNHRLDVVSGLSVSQFDFDAYNEGLDAEDRLRPDDYERLGDIIGCYADDFIADIKRRADELGYSRRQRVNGFRMETTVTAVDDNRLSFYDRNFGGTQLAKITAETQFFGETIRMEMAVIARHGYYDGVNIDQQINLSVDFSSYGEFDDFGNEPLDNAVDFIIDEYGNYRIASIAQTVPYRSGIKKRLYALETVLWQRYEKLVAPYCDQYRVYARFDNGETWYVKTDA